MSYFFKIAQQQNAAIAEQAAVINNLRSGQYWLEEDNQIQREELEKSQKTLKDLETSRKLKDNKIEKRVTAAKGIARRHQVEA